MAQVPPVIAKTIDFSDWENGEKKHDSRIFFQLVLKSQAFEYLKNLDLDELKKKIIIYANKNKENIEADDSEENSANNRFFDFLLINRFFQKERLLKLAEQLNNVLKNPNNDTEDMVKKLVALNENGVFDKLGVGFLISLLPEEKLSDLMYLKLDFIGKDVKPLSAEYGALNYKALYKELTEIQSRLSSRSYDLRLSDKDRDMGDLDIENP